MEQRPLSVSWYHGANYGDGAIKVIDSLSGKRNNSFVAESMINKDNAMRRSFEQMP